MHLSVSSAECPLPRHIRFKGPTPLSRWVRLDVDGLRVRLPFGIPIHRAHSSSSDGHLHSIQCASLPLGIQNCIQRSESRKQETLTPLYLRLQTERKWDELNFVWLWNTVNLFFCFYMNVWIYICCLLQMITKFITFEMYIIICLILN